MQPVAEQADAVDLAGVRTVVTGAGSGIGRALAQRLTAAGARVVVNDRDAGSARAVAAQLGATAVVADVGDPQGVAELVDLSWDYMGGIDIWFGNAGVDRGRGLGSSVDDWDASVRVNLMAHVHAAQSLLPRWSAQGGGRMVITASAAGLLTMLGAPTYSVTKHAAVAFAEWLSATYRHQGVVVQVLCPQAVETGMLAEMGDLRRLISRDGQLAPGDVAEAAVRALSDDRFLVLPHPVVADYVQGKAADVDAWLAAMSRVQRKLEAGTFSDGPPRS